MSNMAPWSMNESGFIVVLGLSEGTPPKIPLSVERQMSRSLPSSATTFATATGMPMPRFMRSPFLSLRGAAPRDHLSLVQRQGRTVRSGFDLPGEGRVIVFRGRLPASGLVRGEDDVIHQHSRYSDVLRA